MVALVVVVIVVIRVTSDRRIFALLPTEGTCVRGNCGKLLCRNYTQRLHSLRLTLRLQVGEEICALLLRRYDRSIRFKINVSCDTIKEHESKSVT